MKVSFIMPSVRLGEKCHQAIQSVLNQSLEEIELICIVPKSQIEHPIFKYIGDPRVEILWDKDCDNPLTAAMNIGIENAHGEIITFCQDDDIQVREKAEFLHHYITDRSIDGVFTGWVIMNSDLKIKGLRLYPRKEGIENFKRAGSYSANGFGVHRESLVSSGLRFDESYRYIHEFIFLFDCATHLLIEDVQFPSFLQRIHKSFSRDDTLDCKLREFEEYARLRKERNDPRIGDLKEKAWRKHLGIEEAA